jgi:hypothetical protein
VKKTYKRILELIEINEEVKVNCEKKLNIIRQYFLNFKPKGYSTSTSYQDYDCIRGNKEELGYEKLQIILVEADKLRELIELHDNFLKSLYGTKSTIDKALKSLNSINSNIAYLQLVEGYPIREIAYKLNISESYAMKLSMNI